MVKNMLFKNAKVYIGGKFILADFIVEDGLFSEITFRVEQSQSSDDSEEDDFLDCSGKLIIPGLIDIHSRGFGDHKFTTCTTKEFKEIGKENLKNGVTTLLATIDTNNLDTFKAVIETMKSGMEEEYIGSRILGINIDAPITGKTGGKTTLDVETYKELNKLSDNNIRIINVDPTLPKAQKFIERNSSEKVITLSSFDLDNELTLKSLKNGASHISNIFSKSKELSENEPGILNILSDFDTYAEITCDGVLIEPSFLCFLYKTLAKKLIITSYTPINDSSTTVFQSIKNLLSYGVPAEQAILSATLLPATVIRELQNIGSIAVGKHADFLILDNDYTILEVYMDGEKMPL